ncbi:signal transducer and activator of transcription 6 isoform X2 [Clupea harengus]|uniref:Signal transducer and activator of transcription n=1 Tax=Clupea harengus TaxID=7950 RepID=A0A6P8FEI2_CLUHA|nr:signal transducer and activator of transcription 6 isoform X2 [Clupea harengus]
MAQWDQMKLLVQQLQSQTLNDLYPGSFPMDVRHYLANWIEDQPWETFDVDNVDQDPQANRLRDQIVGQLMEQAHKNPNVLEKMRLQEFSKKMNTVQPMALVRTVRDVLRKERQYLGLTGGTVGTGLVGQYHSSPGQALHQPGVSPSPSPINGTQNLARPKCNQDMDNLVFKVLEIRKYRQSMHQLNEEMTWEKQDVESMPSPMQTSELDPQQEKQKRIQQLEYHYREYGKKRVHLLHETIGILKECQDWFIQRIKEWRWEQHQGTIGGVFDENLGPLQNRCEQLLGVNVQLRQEVILVAQDNRSSDPFTEMQNELGKQLKALIQSSMVVDKQPPQVIKTQSKFSTTVRYLLGEKVAAGKPIVLKAQIITEVQARSVGQEGGMASENVGELINSTAILEHNPSSKSMCANFRNMSIKKIKRADRKGSESVTEEKFAILFTADIAIAGCDAACSVQTISLPVVIIVHGSQDNNAMATVVWDCAFSEPNRIPFVVPERVLWLQMSMTLSRKFMSEVGTQRCLDENNLHFLAQKVFNKPDITEDFNTKHVTWSQFNKEVMHGRPFTFWQWFDGVMELTKKHLVRYWSDGLIFGFIGKQHLHVILQNKQNGTFLLRFSDSEIGGITIAYVALAENGIRRIQNIQPFTKRDLEIRCLGDRIRDLDFITHVYPDLPKNDVFGQYYTELGPVQPTTEGYLPTTITTTVVRGLDPSSPPSMALGGDDIQMAAFSQGTQFPVAMPQFSPNFSPSHPGAHGAPIFPHHFENFNLGNIPQNQAGAPESMLEDMLPDSIYNFDASM